jgi:hypothetical protein
MMFPYAEVLYMPDTEEIRFTLKFFDDTSEQEVNLQFQLADEIVEVIKDYSF